jgi:hypothetical protein
LAVTYSDRLGLRSGELPQSNANGEVRPGWRALLPSWPLIIGLFAFARTLADPQSVLSDPDTYMHIAAGRWILLHGALPAHDPFSYTKFGAPWVVHEWLAELVLAAVYAVGGWSGLVLLTGAAFALSAALLTRLLLRYAEAFSAVIAALFGCAVALSHLLARPHMLALPLLVLWCGALFRARDAGKAPPLWLLPVMILWANLHASFMFGLALALYLGGEAVLFPASGTSRLGEARHWGFFILSAVIAALCTPNGVAGLFQPFRLIAMPALQRHIIEWQSPDFQHSLSLEIWLLGLVAFGFTSGIRLPPMRLLLLLGLCHMTLQHIRYVDLLGFVAPLAIAAPLGTEITARLSAVPFSAAGRGIMQLDRPAALPATALTLIFAVLVSLPLLLSPIRRADGPMTPARAVAAARGLLKQPVFNSYPFGGYLIFKGVAPFVDGRAEFYGNAFLSLYFKAQQDRDGFAALLDHYHIAWALLTPQDGPALILDGMPDWRRIYSDRYAVVEVRTVKPRKDVNISRAAEKRD